MPCQSPDRRSCPHARPAPKIHSPRVIAHIIDEGNRQFHLLLDDRSERDIEPLTGQVWQELDDACIDIRSARHTNPYALDGACVSVCLCQLADELDDPTNDDTPVLQQPELGTAAGEKSGVSIRDGGTQVGSTKINTNVINSS